MPKMLNYIKTNNRISYYQVFTNLDQVQEAKDLCVIIDRNLNFRKHMSLKISKANSIIFLIKSTFKYLDSEMFNLLYKTLVRPHLEYASPVWRPTLKMDITSLERVQRRATRLVPELKSLSYAERLQHLKLPSLQYRHLRTDLILIYKLSHNFLSLDFNTYCTKCTNQSMLTPSLSQNTRGHSLKYQIHHHQGLRNRFITTRCLNTWNTLHTNTVNATNITSFKTNLSKDLSMPNQYLYTE